MAYMREEIAEQPAIVARLAADLEPYRRACAEAKAFGARFVLYAARGTSDNAAVYGKYLTSIRAGMPAGLAVPSAATLYGAAIDFTDCLVIGISQSGRTPDVAEYLAEARRRGAFTVAITNDADSPLAATAHAPLPTGAGVERAVPATKTYTSQLAVLALLWATWTGDEPTLRAMAEEVPAAMEATLANGDGPAALARSLRWAERLLVAARGYNYATALEAALKLKETCYLAAMPYSAADLMHGPIAVIDPGWPVLIVSHPGAAEANMSELAADLAGRGADVAVIAPPSPALEAAATRLPVAAGLPEELSPLVSILPAQLLSYHLAVERSMDPDNPRGLSKITRTT